MVTLFKQDKYSSSFIAEMDQRCFHHNYTDELERKNQCFRNLVKGYRQAFEDQSVNIFVIGEGTEEPHRNIIGNLTYILPEYEPYKAYLVRFGILPRWRNKGYGTETLKMFEQRIREENRDSIYLGICNLDETSIRFFENAGYDLGHNDLTNKYFPVSDRFISYEKYI